MESVDNIAKKIESLFSEAGIQCSGEQIEQFAIYYNLLVSHNEDFDLTRLKKFDDIVIKHFIDSIYITGVTEIPSPLLDIGTGAGFPGIPLKIVTPGLKLILAEPRHKRVTFLEMAVKELGLTDVEIYPHMVTDKSFFTVQGVITRALEDADATLTRVAHFLPMGGRVILMKGPDADSDLAKLTSENEGGYRLEEDTPYTLPATDYGRRIIVFSRYTDAREKTYRIMKNPDETPGHAVTSPDNKGFKELKKLTAVDGIKKSDKLLISGKKVIEEIVRDAVIPAKGLIIYDGYREKNRFFMETLDEFSLTGSLMILKKSLYNELDIFHTGCPILTIEKPVLPQWDGGISSGCTLLLPFQDPANIGTAIRSAAGFNVDKIVLLKEAAHPYHPKSVRASAGTVFRAPLYNGPSIYDLEKNHDVKNIIVLDRRGNPLRSFKFPRNFILLPGIEGPGVPDELRERAISIPLKEGVESLNGPVALSIALYQWSTGS